MTIVAVLATIVLIVVMTYDGVRSGLFSAVYSLVKNVLAFLIALTLCEPGMSLLTRFLPERHPGPLYYKAIAFATVFTVVFGFGRWLKLNYTILDVQTPRYADYIGGGAFGLLNGIVLGGVVLILWSLMPFAKFLPADFGRIRTEKLPLDSGTLMLRFYDHCTGTMGAGRTFLLQDEAVLKDEEEPYGIPDALRDLDGDGLDDVVPGESFQDLNGNGEWDRGWLWRYRTHADLRPEDVYDAVGAGVRPYETGAGD